MANKNAPNGFNPYSTGQFGTPRLRSYNLISTNAVIGQGTMVAMVADGVDAWTSGAFLGVAAENKAANSGGTILVWDDPQQLFVAQTDDGEGTATTAAALSLNITATANGVSGIYSTQELDESSAAVGATLPWKLMYLSAAPDNAYGEFNRWVVKPNNHQLQGGTGTVGVA